MLTAKENMREVIRGGNPDRFVNQYEAVALLVHPYLMSSPSVKKGGPDVVNPWGVTNSFPANVPGAFPVHTPDKIVVKDIEEWKQYVKAPSLKFSDGLWDAAKEMYNAVDGTKAYKASFVAPGLFEQCHHLMSIQEALMNYMEYPDEMHDLIKYLTDWELELAEGICSNLHPDAIFHHDDWGSEINSFLRPSVFEDFFLEPYQQIYGYYKSHGVELIIHHSDSYCANLLPTMIDMGIDVWQGCMKSNNVPELIKKSTTSRLTSKAGPRPTAPRPLWKPWSAAATSTSFPASPREVPALCTKAPTRASGTPSTSTTVRSSVTSWRTLRTPVCP